MTDTRPTVLVTDDDAEIRAVLCKVLEQAGHLVACASDGEEALEIMHKQPPDLLLVDILMPKIDGLEVVRRMRQSPRLRSIPVIALTAMTSQLIEKEMFDLGVRGFMRKPLHLRGLADMVAAELEALGHTTASS